MKLYHGFNIGTGADRKIKVTVADLDQAPEPVDLPPRRDIYDHSPDGFAWGYLGSGPAQLSLALAADVLGDDQRAQRVYQSLKRTFVDKLDHDRNWTLSDTVLMALIELCEGNQDL